MFGAAIVLAVITEAVVEYVRNLTKGQFTLKKGVALAVALILSFGTGLDLFEMIDIEFQIPYVGTVLIGIFMSRGANFLHDLFEKLHEKIK